MSRACPVCNQTLRPSQQEECSFFPFCSKRCKMLDLGNWLTERYRVAAPPHHDEDSDEVPTHAESGRARDELD